MRKNSPKISVLMPCLNVASYIFDCMQSVMRQSLPDLEILVIDAGSTDGTLEQVEQCQRQDSRIQILHSPVRSYGYQLNHGLRVARGEYVAIVETDDIIEEDMMKVLYDRIQGSDAEYVKGIGEAFFMDGTYPWRMLICGVNPTHEEVVHPIEQVDTIFWDGYIWNGLYRADYIRRFPFHETPGAAYQDCSASFRLLSHAETGLYVNRVVYHYRKGRKDASMYNPRSMEFLRWEYEWIENEVRLRSQEWEKAYFRRMLISVLDRYETMSYGDFWTDDGAVSWLQDKLREGIHQKALIVEEVPIPQRYELWLFLHEPKTLWALEKSKFTYRAKQIQDFLDWVHGRDIFIFGSGVRGRRIKAQYAVCDFLHLIGFCDNDTKKQGIEIDGLHVWNPQKAVQQSNQTVFIIAMAKHADEVREQLLSMGVDGERIRQAKSLYVDLCTLTRLAISKDEAHGDKRTGSLNRAANS